MSGDKLSDVVGDLILLVEAGYGCAWGDGSSGGGSIDWTESSTGNSRRGDGSEGLGDWVSWGGCP